MGMRLRKHADTFTGERIVRFDPVTGAKKLVNPATPGTDHEPWPLAGISIESMPNGEAHLSTTLVAEGVRDGWITGTGERPVVRPAGPEQHVWNSGHTGQPHLFMHYDSLVFHALDGDVEFTVTHQPDKYAAEGDDATPVTPEAYAAGATRVDHFYTVVPAKKKG